MNKILHCVYPIFFSGFGFIVYRSYNYNQGILNKNFDKKLYDTFNAPEYNPFRPQKPT